MDRSFGGALLTIGGRSGNRNFQGEVASTVITTLKLSQTMPDATEIETMIKDPQQWVTTYKVGNTYRLPNNSSTTSNFQKDTGTGYYATQVWLMGDGSSDSYTNGVRNDILKTNTNHTRLTFNSMASNDIQTVNISGLT